MRRTAECRSGGIMLGILPQILPQVRAVGVAGATDWSDSVSHFCI